MTHALTINNLSVLAYANKFTMWHYTTEDALVTGAGYFDGAAIWDLSGGQYAAYSSGYPEKNFMQRTIVTDMKATLQRYDTEYIDASGTVSLIYHIACILYLHLAGLWWLNYR